MNPRPVSTLRQETPAATRIAQALTKIGIALKATAWQGSERSGLTPTQGQALGLLTRQGMESPRMRDLAEELGVTPASASEVVTALVKKGLLRKVKDAADGRSTRVKLTTRGKRAAEDAASWGDFLSEAASWLPPEHAGVMVESLLRMIKLMQDDGRIAAARMCPTCVHFRAFQHTDAQRPHHCALLNSALGCEHLRVDCDEHVAMDAAKEKETWARFVGVPVTMTVSAMEKNV